MTPTSHTADGAWRHGAVVGDLDPQEGGDDGDGRPEARHRAVGLLREAPAGHDGRERREGIEGSPQIADEGGHGDEAEDDGDVGVRRQVRDVVVDPEEGGGEDEEERSESDGGATTAAGRAMVCTKAGSSAPAASLARRGRTHEARSTRKASTTPKAVPYATSQVGRGSSEPVRWARAGRRSAREPRSVGEGRSPVASSVVREQVEAVDRSDPPGGPGRRWRPRARRRRRGDRPRHRRADGRLRDLPGVDRDAEGRHRADPEGPGARASPRSSTPTPTSSRARPFPSRFTGLARLRAPTSTRCSTDCPRAASAPPWPGCCRSSSGVATAPGTSAGCTHPLGGRRLHGRDHRRARAPASRR